MHYSFSKHTRNVREMKLKLFLPEKLLMQASSDHIPLACFALLCRQALNLAVIFEAGVLSLPHIISSSKMTERVESKYKAKKCTNCSSVFSALNRAVLLVLPSTGVGWGLSFMRKGESSYSNPEDFLYPLPAVMQLRSVVSWLSRAWKLAFFFSGNSRHRIFRQCHSNTWSIE